MRLTEVPLGTVVRLANGRIVMVTGPTKNEAWKRCDFRWVHEYFGEEEYLPGKWGPKMGTLEPAMDQDVTYVDKEDMP